MKISGKIKKRKAIIISAESLQNLCDIVLKHCERIEFSAETYAKTSITFDNLEELLKYDNFKPRRIISLELTGYNDHFRTISIEIGDVNFSPIVNYGCTMRSNYCFSSVDSETVFIKDLDIWYQKAKSNYWLIGKFSFMGLLFVPSAIVTLIRFIFGIRTDIDLSNSMVLIALLIVLALCAAVMTVLKLIDAYVLGNLFPAVVFQWGEEIKRFKKWDKLRSNLLWAIIIALIMGVVGNYIYDTLKGL